MSKLSPRRYVTVFDLSEVEFEPDKVATNIRPIDHVWREVYLVDLETGEEVAVDGRFPRQFAPETRGRDRLRNVINEAFARWTTPRTMAKPRARDAPEPPGLPSVGRRWAATRRSSRNHDGSLLGGRCTACQGIVLRWG